MALRQKTYTFILALTFSLLFAAPAKAQLKKIVEVPDSTPLFHGIEVSTDLVGPVMMAVGSYGHLEADVRLNLKDRYFPVVELGYAKCDETDDGTSINYKTKAPYFRAGIDFNVMKNKHDVYRLYVGARYGFTSFKVDYSSLRPVIDPMWGEAVPQWGETGMDCKYHWAEAVFGLQAKIWGPVSLGWSVRYRKRVSYSNGEYSKSWYVPGYGKSDNSAIFATFNFILGI